jgi:hypothetical protein
MRARSHATVEAKLISMSLSARESISTSIRRRSISGSGGGGAVFSRRESRERTVVSVGARGTKGQVVRWVVRVR